MTERWYSVDEIAAHLGIGRETVYRWIEQKGLPTHRNREVLEVQGFGGGQVGTHRRGRV